MTKVTLTNINRTPRVSSKSGRPFTSLGIRTNEHGAKWLSGFDGPETANWKEGDTVEIEIETKGEYLNFKVPKKAQAPAGDINRVEVMVRTLITEVQMIRGIMTDHKEVLGSILKRVTPVNEINAADLEEPF